MPYGEAVNSRLDHVDFWPKLKQWHPHLCGREYFELPPVYVLFRRREDRFAVMMDRTLYVPFIKVALRLHFYLPTKGTTLERDAYYTSDPDELRSVLED